MDSLRPVGTEDRTALRVALIGLALVLIGAMVALGYSITHRLEDLEDSTSDNSQWVVMQTEVETLKLQLAVSAALAGGAQEVQGSLSDVRLWFDILFSRISLMKNSPIYKSLLDMPEFAAHYDDLDAFIARTVPVIDGPDEALQRALPGIVTELPQLRQSAREMSLVALATFAAQSDDQRDKISYTLIGLAGLAVSLVVLLSLLSYVLTELYRKSRRQTRDMEAAGLRMRTIITTSADAIVVTNRGGWIVEYNPAAEIIFGIPRERAMGQNAMELLFPRELADVQRAAVVAAATALAGGPMQPFRIELEAMRGDGTLLPIEVSVAASQVARGSVVVAFVRDISDRRRTERTLLDARDRALAGERAKARFIAMMSHEMRTPLNGLLGALDLIEAEALPPDERELLAMMRVSGQILLDNVNAVLEVARDEAGQLQVASRPFDLDRLIVECLDNQAGLAARAGNRLSARSPEGPVGPVLGDPVRLRQVLLNLIGNAVKFTRGGEVAVEVERMPPRPGRGSGLVEIRVIDTGPGIAEAELDRIFDDFVTLERADDAATGGSGLGLGIARRLVQAMGGTLGVESEQGDGSLFWVQLPLDPAPSADEAPAPTALPVGPAQRILVVEDNEISRAVLVRMLRRAGHVVSEATDGLAGVETASATAFDVVLTDIAMPRLDGVEAARRIRSGGASSAARILALTAHALPQDQSRFLTAGLDGCLTKPVTFDVLVAAIAGRAPPDTPPAPPVPATDLPLVDECAIADLARALGRRRFAAFVAQLGAEAEAALPRIAGQSGRAQLEHCHQLAGSTGTFGLRRMAAVLGQIEVALRSATPDGAERARALAAGLPALWAATRAELAARLESGQDGSASDGWSGTDGA